MRPRWPCRHPAPPLPFREDIWFDDVDPADIEAAIGPEAAAVARKQLGRRGRSVTLVKEQAFGGYAGGGLRGAPTLQESRAGTCQCPCDRIELVTLRSMGDGWRAGADRWAPRRRLTAPAVPLQPDESLGHGL